MPGIPGAGFLLLHPEDTVVTVLRPFRAGEVLSLPAELGLDPVTVREDVPTGHKIAIRPVRQGEHVRKYGEVIGQATADIPPGAHVHTHNLAGTRGRGDLGLPSVTRKEGSA